MILLHQTLITHCPGPHLHWPVWSNDSQHRMRNTMLTTNHVLRDSSDVRFMRVVPVQIMRAHLCTPAWGLLQSRQQKNPQRKSLGGHGLPLLLKQLQQRSATLRSRPQSPATPGNVQLGTRKRPCRHERPAAVTRKQSLSRAEGNAGGTRHTVFTSRHQCLSIHVSHLSCLGGGASQW